MKIFSIAFAFLLGFGAGAPMPGGQAWAHDKQTGMRHLLDDLVTDRTNTIPDPPAGKAALRLNFTYVHDSLPGFGIRFYEPHPDVDSLWAEESLPKGEEFPVGSLIKDRILFLNPGEARMVTLGYQNPTGKDVSFMVAPHREIPASLMPYTWLTCLCMAMVYSAPSEGSWYRVISLAVSPDILVGSKVDVIWPVLTDPATFPEMK
ncbi:MAG: hypothetical protein O7G83_03765 [Proteobacteria bacterium]|nr:hypothetical protein [Pseudomonadota bacterium]